MIRWSLIIPDLVCREKDFQFHFEFNSEEKTACEKYALAF